MATAIWPVAASNGTSFGVSYSRTVCPSSRKLSASPLRKHSSASISSTGIALHARLFKRQVDVEDGSMGMSRGKANASSVRQHNLLSNGKAETGTMRFRGLEQTEHIDAFRNSGTGILHRNAHVAEGRNGDFYNYMSRAGL